MPFHFTGFSFSSPFHFFTSFSLSYSGGGVPYALDIVAYAQPSDRYSEVRGVAPSALIQLVGPQLPLLPMDYEGFIVERSDDGGTTWADVSSVVRDSFFFIDYPASAGIYHYRARMRITTGLESGSGNEVVISVGRFDDADELGLTEMGVGGVQVNRLSRAASFPIGFDDEDHSGMSISEGSLAGGYGNGAWYIKTKEFIPPTVFAHSPVCSTTGVSLPLTVITYKIQDLPYPSGGSGIDDSYTTITLAVTSQSAGAPVVIRQGLVQPASPTITCVIAPGAVPALDRDVTITVPAGYISSDDVVTVVSYVKDLDGNITTSTCEFEMEHLDNTAPVISEQDPSCGSGVGSDDANRVERDSGFSFNVSDADSGVDPLTIDVYVKEGAGPYQQVLSNGVTYLLGYTGSVVSDGSTGYDVEIHRPVIDPLWAANSVICVRMVAEDLDGNIVDEECCFRVEDEARIGRVVPIAEDIIYVEFTIDMLNSKAVRDATNYAITAQVPADAELVFVKSVQPHSFSPAVDPRQPNVVLGDGDPRFVYLNTSVNSPWELYDLEISGDNVLDRYGQPMATDGREFSYRGRRTKVDEGRDSMDGLNSRDDSITRKVLVGVMSSDEQIGGLFIDDDWE